MSTQTAPLYRVTAVYTIGSKVDSEEICAMNVSLQFLNQKCPRTGNPDTDMFSPNTVRGTSIHINYRFEMCPAGNVESWIEIDDPRTSL